MKLCRKFKFYSTSEMGALYVNYFQKKYLERFRLDV